MTPPDLDDTVALSFEGEVSELISRLERYPVPKNPIVLFGASSVRMWTDLAERLHRADVVRVGFGGATVSGMIRQVPRIAALLSPRCFIIWPGSNDIGNLGKTAEQVASGLVELVRTTKEALPNASIYFMSAFVPPGRIYVANEILETNRKVEIALKDIDQVECVPVHEYFIGDNGAPVGYFFSDDGIHLNYYGYDVIEMIMRESIESLKPVSDN